ncbi:hypothetical protein EJB05_29441, partial [Eragrostis curvula]
MAIPVARVHLAMAHAGRSSRATPDPTGVEDGTNAAPDAVVLPKQSPPPKPGRADAEESNSSANSRPASSSEKWSSNKRAISVSGAASAERWDARKQPRPVRAKEVDDDDKSSTGSNDVEVEKQKALEYAGPGFIVSPEPGMLPMPSFMLRVA